MSRLNNALRFSATFLNTLIFQSGLFFIALGAFTIAATVRRFATSTLSGWLSWLIIGGFVLTVLAITGCCGTFHQTQRTGKCAGRRVLSAYQFLIIGLMVGSFFAVLFVRALSEGFRLIERYPTAPLDSGEKRIEPYFNEFYWKAQNAYNTGGSSYEWFVGWTKRHCPPSMEITNCRDCSGVSMYTPDSCCPNYIRCNAGNPNACPYLRCRRELASYLKTEIREWQTYCYVAALIFLVVSINTCLLICYNPRDTLSDLLTKTGIVVHPHHTPKRRPTPRSPARSPRGGGTPRSPGLASPRSGGTARSAPEAPSSPRAFRDSAAGAQAVADLEAGSGSAPTVLLNLSGKDIPGAEAPRSARSPRSPRGGGGGGGGQGDGGSSPRRSPRPNSAPRSPASAAGSGGSQQGSPRPSPRRSIDGRTLQLSNIT